MDQQADVAIHFMPVDGLVYFLPHACTVDQIAGIEIADLSDIQDVIKGGYEPLRLPGLETV